MNDDGKFLDDLEDAQAVVERYVRGIRWSVISLAISIVSVLLGSYFGQLAFGAALVIMGGSGVLLSVGAGWLWFWYNHTAIDTYGRKSDLSPFERLRKAERAYRNSLS